MKQAKLPPVYEKENISSTTHITNIEWEDAPEKTKDIRSVESYDTQLPEKCDHKHLAVINEDENQITNTERYKTKGDEFPEQVVLDKKEIGEQQTKCDAEEQQGICDNLEQVLCDKSEQQAIYDRSQQSDKDKNLTKSLTQTEQTKIDDTSIKNESLSGVQIKCQTPEILEEIEQDTEISSCFVSNYTLEYPFFCEKEKHHLESKSLSELNHNTENSSNTLNGNHKTEVETRTSVNGTNLAQLSPEYLNEKADEEDISDSESLRKFTAASCDLVSIIESLYSINESPAFQVLPGSDENFEEMLYILSEGAFYEYPEDNYLVKIEKSIIYIIKDSQILLSLNMKYGEVSIGMKNILKVDNRMGRYFFIKCEFESMINLKTEIELHCLQHWQTDCIQLVHYPLKCHQNTVIVDLGSCSTRAGILMDQPTLPSIFFPTVCAADRKTGTTVYGMEALRSEVRQHSNLSFPCRPSIKITKHTIDINLLEGLFKKIFTELHVNPADYTVLVCLPRNLSTPAQNALVNLLLKNLKVKSVSLANQALLTLYAHEVSTAVVVNIGDRTEVIPVVDGFIVENGVTKLPYGGQRLIHHMKHSLAEKRITLSSDIDSFIVQYIIENLAYVANDYDHEMKLASQHPDFLKKTITLQPASSKQMACKNITLEEARFKICEGLFDPELWGLDSPGIHHLVNKAIQTTGVDVRKRIAENIYVSGGVTMLPGFVERLNKEVSKLSKAKIVPKVFASNYRYHCTYIGACKFAKMKVFSEVCISLQEYCQNNAAALKKCALCF